MDTSTDNFELSASTVKIGTDSSEENGSDKSDELVFVGDDLPSRSNLPDTVSVLKDERSGSTVYLVGTAHFSKQSQQDVALMIQTVQPNVVVLELCQSRTNILSLDEQTILQEAKNIDFAKIRHTIQENGLYNGFMYLLLLNMSAHITKEIGMAPGGEFRVAYKEAQNVSNCFVSLGDRPIDVTIKRALNRLSWWQTGKLAWHLLTSKDPISCEDIEKCKNKDMLEQLLAELAGDYPEFREVFLDERDAFLCNSLQRAATTSPNLKVVGVVGIGHVPGITKLWPHSQSHLIAGIMEVPPPSKTAKLVKITCRVSLVTFGGYLVYRFFPLPKLVRDNFGSVAQRLFLTLKKSTDFALIAVQTRK